jgi:hypothetical protein
MKSILFVEVGSEPGQEKIIDEIRKRRSDLRLLGLAPRSATEVTYDRVVATFEESFFGSHKDVFRRGLFVPPEVFRKLRKDYGMLLRLTDRAALHDPTTVDELPGRWSSFDGSFNDRIDLVNRQAAYWSHTLREEGICAVVMANFGHVGYDAVIQSVAKAMGIPCLFFTESPPFWGRLQMYEEISEIGNLALGCELVGAAEFSSYETIGAERHKQHLFDQVINAVGPIESQLVGVKSSLLRRHYLKKQVKRVRSWLFGSNKKKRARRFIGALALIRDLKQSASRDELPENYVLYEFHAEPNGTIGVRCWMYPDQRDAVFLIASSLPAGWKLVVKETSRQWSRHMPRPPGYWSGIAMTPNIQIVSHKREMKKLIPKASAVLALSNSSHALSALSLGIPVIAMGQTILDQLHGVRKVETQDEAIDALREITKVRTVDREAFLSSVGSLADRVMRSTVEGSLTSVPSHISSTELPEYLNEFPRKVAQVVVEWFRHHSL